MEAQWPTRWWVYQQERFPLAVHAPLIAAFSFSAVAFSALLRHGGPPEPRAAIVGFVSALIFFFQLRVADEFKDAADDARYRPYRPVPRGLVTLRELAGVGVEGALVQLVLALWLAPSLVPLLVMVWAYLGLMTREFFVGGWLRAHPLLYLVSHMPIVVLIDAYVSACDWRAAGTPPPEGLIWLMGLSFFNGVVIEIGRKVRAPGDEEHGVETYSALWGSRRAVLAWLIVLSLTAVLSLAAAYTVGTMVLVGALLLMLLLTACVAAACFVRHPTTARARLLEGLSGVTTLVVYLSVGALPLLAHAVRGLGR